MRICGVLDVTPNDLLAERRATVDEWAPWLSRLTAVARDLSVDDLKVAVAIMHFANADE